MKINPKLEEFYIAMLRYAGLDVNEDGEIFVNSGKKEKVKAEDGKVFCLPYSELLKKPEGRKFFHVLNENFVRPESEAFKVYKKNLLLEANVKLVYLMGALIDIGSQPDLQKSIKSREVIEVISQIGEVEPVMKETLLEKILPRANKENGAGAFIDFFLRKNGKLKDVDYGVIGKTNFLLYKELNRALEDKEYKVYGLTVRKKDILAYINILQAIFPEIEDQDVYSSGTDNLVFGHLNALLLTSYIPINRMNEVLESLSKDLGDDGIYKELMLDLSWAELINEIYGMAKEIRYIPNQDDVAAEASRKLKVDESASVTAPPPQTPIPPQQPSAPAFNPEALRSTPQQPAPTMQPAYPQQQQPTGRPSLEETLANMGNISDPFNQPPVMPYGQPQQGYGMPVYGQVAQVPPPPAWLRDMQQGNQPQQPMQPQYQQPQQPYGMMGNAQYQAPMYANQNQMAYGQQPMSPYQQPNQFNNPYMNQGYGANPYGNQFVKRDAFSQIEQSTLNGGRMMY